MNRYYFDTSIWLDFFENRNEPSLSKGDLARKLIDKIIRENGKIICSEAIKNEMISLKYSRYEIESLFLPYKKIILWTHTNKKQFGKAKDLSKRRNIPLLDVLHAILAKDNRATLITRDGHFDKLRDIILKRRPEDFI